MTKIVVRRRRNLARSSAEHERRFPQAETPAEHLRNALMVLQTFPYAGTEAEIEDQLDAVSTVIARVRVALGQIEGRNPPRRPRLTRRRAGLLRDVRFYRAHAGGVVGEATKGALLLARARKEAARRGWEYTWEYEQERYEDMYGQEAPPDAEFFTIVLWDRDPEQAKREGEKATPLASLGFVDTRDPNYVKVVEAELALEALGRASPALVKKWGGAR